MRARRARLQQAARKAAVMAAAAKAPRKATNKARTLASIKSLDPEDDERTTISKKISWILRHGAPKGYVECNPDGWVQMSDLLKAEILEGVSRETIDRVIIDSNAKKLRYQLSNDGSKIRAYEKKERKALVDSAEAPKEGAGMRAEATEFVPNTPGTPSGAGMAAMGYPWPYGFGVNPLMGMSPFGWPGIGMPQSRVPMPPAMPQALPAGRFRGKIKSFNPDKGFGFIECREVNARYGRDTFVHKAQIGDLKAGADVIFSVECNKQGMPQAKDVTSGSGMPAVPGGAPAGKGKKGGKDSKGKGAKGEGKGAKGEGKGGKEGKKKAKEPKEKTDKSDEAAAEAPKAEEPAAEAPKAEEPAAA